MTNTLVLRTKVVLKKKKIGSQLLVGCRTLFNTCCHTIDAQLLMESESCTRKYKHNDNSQFHIMTCQILYFTYRLDIGTVHCTLYQSVRFLQQIKSNTFTTESIRSKVNTVVGGGANRVSQRAHNATISRLVHSMFQCVKYTIPCLVHTFSIWNLHYSGTIYYSESN